MPTMFLALCHCITQAICEQMTESALFKKLHNLLSRNWITCLILLVDGGRFLPEEEFSFFLQKTSFSKRHALFEDEKFRLPLDLTRRKTHMEHPRTD